jgi:nitrogen regulatory protein P-II 1
MVKIEAIIRPCMLDEVKAALESIGVEYVTSSEVLESGGRSTYRAVYRGAEYRVDEPRMKLEILACSDRTDELVEMLSGTARTRTSSDDGVIMVYQLNDAIRIANGSRPEFGR